jgi:UDP-GlcNAc:undecaprenyl-phosphate GlcNAc-1-phosphate transferase
VRRLAFAIGMVAQPKRDRWHQKPTAMMGGLAIMGGVVVTAVAFYPRLLTSVPARVTLGTSLFLCLVGLVDDIKHIKPYQKLIGQLMGASVVIYAGLTLPWTSSTTANIAITFFWLVGITNAVNLLDNMDGLAAGVSMMAAAFMAVGFFMNGQVPEATLFAVFAASLAGFLIFNSNPASIFMGDVGSMFVGFFLASGALMSSAGTQSRSLVVVVAVPVLVLLIPIFDTTLVTVVRKLSGRAASQGGRDHTSHRLVALGLSERNAVLLLWGLAMASGLLAVMVNELEIGSSVVIISLFAIALAILGTYLGNVRVYDEAEMRVARERPLTAFMAEMTYKRRVFEVLLDLVLIIVASYVARAVVSGPVRDPQAWDHFAQTTATLVVVQLSCLLIGGAYRGLWRYVSVGDLLIYSRAVFAGTVTGYLVLRVADGAGGLRAAAMLVDGMCLLLLLASSRVAFRMFRRFFPVNRRAAKSRVLIYGAGDGGELLMRELTNNGELGMLVVGFVDDDPLKIGKVIHGLPVYPAGPDELIRRCQQLAIHELIVSSQKISEENLRRVCVACLDANLSVRRMRLALDPIHLGELAKTEAEIADRRVRRVSQQTQAFHLADEDDAPLRPKRSSLQTHVVHAGDGEPEQAPRPKRNSTQTKAVKGDAVA